MRLIPFALALLLLFSPLWALAKESPRKNATVDVRPVYEQDGSFGFCIADRPYDDGRKFTLAYSPRTEINIGLAIPGGGFKKTARYDLLWSLDGTEPRSVRAVALNENELLLQMGANALFRRQFANASVLTIGTGSKKMAFDLPRMSDVFARLETCLKTHKDKTREVTSDSSGDFPDALHALLAKAGQTPITPVNMRGIPTEERPADFVWQFGEVLGGVRERAAPPHPNLSKLIGLHLQGLKNKCGGRFSSSLEKEQKNGDLLLRRAEAGCAPKDNQSGMKVVVALLFYLTPNGGFTVFTHEALDTDKTQALKARDTLANVLLDLASAK